jgi:hypothetical protein
MHTNAQDDIEFLQTSLELRCQICKHQTSQLSQIYPSFFLGTNPPILDSKPQSLLPSPHLPFTSIPLLNIPSRHPFHPVLPIQTPPPPSLPHLLPLPPRLPLLLLLPPHPLHLPQPRLNLPSRGIQHLPPHPQPHQHPHRTHRGIKDPNAPQTSRKHQIQAPFLSGIQLSKGSNRGAKAAGTQTLGDGRREVKRPQKGGIGGGCELILEDDAAQDDGDGGG